MNSVESWLNDSNEKRLKEFPAKMNILNCKELKEEMESLQDCVDNINYLLMGMGIL